MKSKPESRPNLYLVGFMGTGKSVVGRRAADALGLEFVDSDHWIEACEGKTISRIFAEDGEAYFRARERAFIEGGHAGSGCLVSCGGGLIIQPGMIERLKRKGVLVCLFASAETVIERTQGNADRPLLQGGESHEERVRRLLEEREPVYRQAGTLISTDHRPFPDVVHHVVRVYQEALGSQDR